MGDEQNEQEPDALEDEEGIGPVPRMSDAELIGELSRQANELGINVQLTYNMQGGAT